MDQPPSQCLCPAHTHVPHRTRHRAPSLAGCSRAPDWADGPSALLAAAARPERQGAAQGASELGAPGSAQVLALHLLVEAARGAASFWAAYLAQLPRAHTCLSYFGATEADALQVPPAACVPAGACSSAHQRRSRCGPCAGCCKCERKQQPASGLVGVNRPGAGRQVGYAVAAAADAAARVRAEWRGAAPALACLGAAGPCACCCAARGVIAEKAPGSCSYGGLGAACMAPLRTPALTCLPCWRGLIAKIQI